MTRLGLYLARQLLAPLLLATLLICVLVLALQAMRLGHHLLASTLGLRTVAQLVVLALPTLLLYALPAAIIAALLFTLLRLRAGGELEGLASVGANPWRTALPTLGVVAVVAAITALLAAQAEPTALRHLDHLLRRCFARALLDRTQARYFHQLPGSTTLRVDRLLESEADRLRAAGVFIAAGNPSRLIVARSAEITAAGSGRLDIALSDGQLLAPDHGDSLLRIDFATLRYRVDLTAGFAEHFGFLARAGGPHRPWDRAATALSYGLLGLLIGLAVARPLIAIALALLGVAAIETVSIVAQQAFAPMPHSIFALLVLIIALAAIGGFRRVWSLRRRTGQDLLEE